MPRGPVVALTLALGVCTVLATTAQQAYPLPPTTWVAEVDTIHGVAFVRTQTGLAR